MKLTALTPIGSFLFPKLNKGDPDEYKGAKKYKTDLVCEEVEDFADLQTQADAVLTEFLKKEKIPTDRYDIKPLVTPNNFTDKETGDLIERGYKIKSACKAVYLKGETVVKFEPNRVGVSGDPLTDGEKIDGFCKGRLSIFMVPYCMDDKGIVGVSLRLNGIQVTEFGSGSGEAFTSLSDEEPTAFDD